MDGQITMITLDQELRIVIIAVVMGIENTLNAKLNKRLNVINVVVMDFILKK
jgi:hypothetical protein